MKGKLSTLAFVLILSTLIVSGCGTTTVPAATPTEVAVEAPDVIVGSGNVVTEDRPVSDFNRVSLTSVGQVIITQGEGESLTVETDDNLMRYIKTEVKNGTLILGFTDEVKNKSIRPSERIVFNLSAKDITALDVSGAGDINASSLDADRLEVVIGGAGDVDIGSLTADELVVRISGAGDAELAGQVVEQNIAISGAGDYRATDLESQATIVEVSGAGDATLWATDTLDVRISGVGSVEYYGSPSVTQNISGVGKLTSLGEP